MARIGIRNVVTWIVVGLVVFLFLFAGTAKFQSAEWRRLFAAWGYPPWLLTVVGGAEIVGALLLCVPAARRSGAVLLLIVMIGAIYTHLANGEAVRVGINFAIVGALLLVSLPRRI